MKQLILKFLGNLSLSMVCGVLLWGLAYSLLLPVTDAGDSEGHGPDAGTVEWNNVIQQKTINYQRDARDLGVIGGTLAFTGLILVRRRGHRREQQS